MREAGDDMIDVVIDPDRIARDLSPQAPESAQVEAGRAAILLFNRSIVAGKSVSLETTLTGATVLRRIKDARRAGYEISLRYVALASVDLHINRIEQRVMKGGHHIPTETLLRRYEASLDNLPRALTLADHVTIVDNSGREKQILLRSAYGAILELFIRPPLWFVTRLPAIREAIASYPNRRL